MNESGLDYPGIGRLHYFLAHIGLFAAVVLVVNVFGPDSPVMDVMTVVMMIGVFILDVLRLKNMGLSQWFAFIRYLPFGGTLLAMALLCAPTGWAETRKLDSAGKSILIVEVILLAMLLFLIFRSGPDMFSLSDLIWVF